MILIIMGFIYYAYRKHNVKKWMIPGLCGSMLGYSLLVIAPGNYVRYGHGPRLIVHLTNQLGAGFEILLGVIPVILFLVLAWRVLLNEYAKQKGIYTAKLQDDGNNFGFFSIVRVTIALLMLVSFLKGSFVSERLANMLYNKLAVPLGVGNSHLKLQLFNTMSGLEEVVLYFLVITQIYSYILKKLGLRKKDIQDIVAKVEMQEIMRAYPACYFVAMLIALAVINNLIMVGAPIFPGRAGFGSVVFLIIGAVSVFTIPEISITLLKGAWNKVLAVLAGLIVIPMGGCLISAHYFI
jgi:hypothetical protein